VDVTLVTDDIAGLEPDWRALTDRDTDATPFSSFQWASAWLRHWREGGAPWVLVAREKGRVVGLAPFVAHRRGGMRLLRGLGVGVGNYWDVLADPDRRGPVLAAVGRELRRRAAEWDVLFVDKLPEESGTPAALAAAGLRLGPAASSPSPRIELPATFDEYLVRLSANRRQKLRRNLRVLDGGELSVAEVTDPERVARAVDRWQALRVQWWAERERSLQSEHAGVRFLEFTQEAIAAMIPAGLAAVWEARVGEEVLGVALNFLDGRTFYYWLWGFDRRLAKLRPGHVLLAHAIRWSIETGRRHFDFMIGDEAYKYDYAPTDRAVLAFEVGSGRPRSRAALGLVHLRRAARPPRSA